jgi:hypothetical protein
MNYRDLVRPMALCAAMATLLLGVPRARRRTAATTTGDRARATASPSGTTSQEAPTSQAPAPSGTGATDSPPPAPAAPPAAPAPAPPPPPATEHPPVTLGPPPPASREVWPDGRAPLPASVGGGGENDAAVVIGITDYAFLPKVPGADDNAAAWVDYLRDVRKVPFASIFPLPNASGARESILEVAQQASKGSNRVALSGSSSLAMERPHPMRRTVCSSASTRSRTRGASTPAA